MKEAIKFILRSNFAIVKKPESNTTYFTYNNVHKMVLLGIFGSIIGENGYNYNLLSNNEKGLPDFYKNLKDFKIAIKPNIKFGNFIKKIQGFNNSVGYASKEEGGNLIVTEQWLENPSWTIYILENEEERFKKLKDYLLNSKCEYIPYIGKNDHFATIEKVELVNADSKENVQTIESLFIDEDVEILKEEGEEYIYNENDDIVKFEYKEVMPTALNEKIGYVDFKSFVFTNKKVKIKNGNHIFNIKGENIYFF